MHRFRSPVLRLSHRFKGRTALLCLPPAKEVASILGVAEPAIAADPNAADRFPGEPWGKRVYLCRCTLPGRWRIYGRLAHEGDESAMHNLAKSFDADCLRELLQRRGYVLINKRFAPDGNWEQYFRREAGGAA